MNLAQNSTSHRRIINNYMKLRHAKQNEDLMNLVSNDIVIDSERDGVFQGREEYRKYLATIKPTGVWQQAQSQNGYSYVEGVVNYLWINWNVTAYVKFKPNNLIQHIKIRRGHFDESKAASL